jgi:hypothetical protein
MVTTCGIEKVGNEHRPSQLSASIGVGAMGLRKRGILVGLEGFTLRVGDRVARAQGK